MSVRVWTPTKFRADTVDGGTYRITGTVDELGVFGRYPVALFDRQSMRCIRTAISTDAGQYAFRGLSYRERGYFAIALDYGSGPINAAIADMLTPEPMP